MRRHYRRRIQVLASLIFTLLGLYVLLFDVSNETSDSKGPREDPIPDETDKALTIEEEEDTNLLDKPGQSLAYGCELYPLNSDLKGKFDCINLIPYPQPWICLYPRNEDVLISGMIRETGDWETSTSKIFRRILTQNADIDLIDADSHIGMYALTAAALNRGVIAVEPYIDNLRKIHKAVLLNKLQDGVTLLKNTVSWENKKVWLKLRGNKKLSKVSQQDCTAQDKKCFNIQAVTLNDLLPIAQQNRVTKAMLRLDGDGMEHKILAQARTLFESIYIPYILMNLDSQREICQEHSSEERGVQHAVGVLVMLGYDKLYDAEDEELKTIVSVTDCAKWPDVGLLVHKKEFIPKNK